ncbi:MAG: zinc ABC transporter substrate-binding protein [Thermomicrobiales bacterium]|nr:zinc ABC transporter substrate-binding protein [Thermomicrobiales bacterium]
MLFQRRLLMGFLLMALALGVLPLMGRANVSAQDEPITVVATTGMVGDLARNIGGEHVDVTDLMGPGIDPHLYKARESDVERLASADIIFYSGLHLEAQLGDVFEQMEGQITTVAVTRDLPRDLLISLGEDTAGYDPHVWFDTGLWAMTIDTVRDTLVAYDPDNAADYIANADAYRAQLEELDAYVQAQAETIPAEQRVLITAHDAFSYFAQAYGFEVHGIQGVSTVTEAGTGDIQELADFIVERGISAIFVESSVTPRTIEALQEAVQSRGHDVQIGGELFSDAMGDAGTPEGTYIGMVTHNIDTIVAALAATP